MLKVSASPNINRVMTVFSPQPLKMDVIFFTPPEESELQWIIKDNDVYF